VESLGKAGLGMHDDLELEVPAVGGLVLMTSSAEGELRGWRGCCEILNAWNPAVVPVLTLLHLQST